MKNNNLTFFIQARMKSSRLPGKVLLNFDEQDSILSIIVSKLKLNFPQIPIVLCTSNVEEDDLIEAFCSQNQIQCFRGSETNVLNRFIKAAQNYESETIIRICADNPFLDVIFLKELIHFYENNPNADYWSFKNSEGTPVIKTHFGLFAEITTIAALKKVEATTNDNLYLEHVTNFIYTNSNFKCLFKTLPNYLINREDLRFTIDDKEDFINLQKVYSIYKQNSFSIEETIQFLDSNNDYLEKMKINIKKYSK